MSWWGGSILRAKVKHRSHRQGRRSLCGGYKGWHFNANYPGRVYELFSAGEASDSCPDTDSWFSDVSRSLPLCVIDVVDNSGAELSLESGPPRTGLVFYLSLTAQFGCMLSFHNIREEAGLICSNTVIGNVKIRDE